MKNQFTIVLLLFTSLFTAQRYKPVNQVADSLLQREYNYLSESIDKYQESGKAWMYIKAYLAKAKAEHNWKETTEAYKNFLHASKENERPFYADSMVRSALKSHDNDVIGSAYLTKGIVDYSLKKHVNALDNYIIANTYISKGNNDYLKYKVKFNIAHIKYYLGFFSEALSLYNECVVFFKNDDPWAYLSSLHSLGLCYNRMGNFKQCHSINAFALKESSRLKNGGMVPYLHLSEGINAFCSKKYNYAITLITKSLYSLETGNDFGNLSVAYFYLGKTKMVLKDTATALPYFRKVDHLFAEKNYLRPDERENYEILIKHSRNKGSLSSELFYVKRLLSADSLLNSNYKYLSQKVHKEYDTTELLKAKGVLESQLNRRKSGEKLFFVFAILLLFLLLYLVYRYLKAKQQYQQRFELLIQEKTNDLSNVEFVLKEEADEEIERINIRPEVVAHILKQLQKFEENHKYLQPDLTAVKLAEWFGTNHKYLAKVILMHKNKKFITYITDLKIDYIIDLLKNQSKFRNYTNKALAEEAGFSTTQNFTKAFIKRTQISPTYFIEELKKHYNEKVV